MICLLAACGISAILAAGPVQSIDNDDASSRPPVMPAPQAQIDSGVARSQVDSARRPAGAGNPSITAPRTSATTQSAARSPASIYGLWTLAPALVAILLAMATRQVLIALFLGVFTASGMICHAIGINNPFHYVTYMMDHFVLGVLAPMKDDGSGADYEHLTILVYTLFIGAMIGVLNANGGTRALVAAVTRRVRTREGAQLGALGGGLAVFFDDYASAMMVGPGLQPIFDRLRMSREKLAHIVNWTAAPDASMFLGTWLAVQISWIGEGLSKIGNRPEFLEGVTPGSVFWASIPYRAYPILCLMLLLWIALSGRDIGGIRRAERAAAAGPRPRVDMVVQERESSKGWSLAAIPAFVLVFMTVALMLNTGMDAAHTDGETLGFQSFAEARDSIVVMFSHANSHFSLLYASLAAAVVAILMSLSVKSLSETMEGAVRGMTAMFAATMILVLAWGLSQASKDLELREVAGAFLQGQIDQKHFSVFWLPTASFVTACIISFSTGSAWGTMGILLPPIISVAAGLLAGLPPDQARSIFLGTAGAVMAGAVFGNTCSPLADVTVLSATFSGCDLTAHARTVFPLALIVAGVSIVCTGGLDSLLRAYVPSFFIDHWNPYAGLGIGALMLFFIVLFAGRKPIAPPKSLSIYESP